MSSVISLLLVENQKPFEIHWHLCKVYGNKVMCVGGLRQWCIMFKNDCTNFHDEERSGRPTILTDELVAKINEKIHENRRFTITEFLLEFPQISRSLLHEIVKEKLGYHKFCVRWVPKLSEDHKKQRMASSLTFLEAYVQDGDSLLDRVVTGDETWEKHETCETKNQSME